MCGSAIGYDAITVVRLIAVLEMIDTTDDLHSDNWKDFVLRFADSITPAGCFSNHVRTAAANPNAEADTVPPLTARMDCVPLLLY